MKDRLLAQAKHEYSEKQRNTALLFLAPIFLFLLPYLLVSLGAKLDQRLGLPGLKWPLTLILGLLLVLPGLSLGLWSVYAQMTIGRGTPVPVMATQKLVDQPPFSYCRNPMALGAILMYTGAAVLFGSLGALILAIPGAVLLLTYIKLIEEKEMELRFGQEYLEYRQRTPFLIPRFKK